MNTTSHERPKHSKLLLALLFLFALLVRSYKLGSLPPTFYTEELTNTYVGRFILLHGKDIYGNFLPLVYFDKFGDYPPILPLYLSGISTFFFGVNEFAGRFPLALIGALLVIPVYLLTYTLVRRKGPAIFAALITAVLPWHVVLSRTTAEGIVGLTAYAYAIFYLLRGIEETKYKDIFKAAVLFFLCYFLYPALRILVPLTLLPLCFFPYLPKSKLQKPLVFLTLTFFLLTGYITSTHWGKARFEQTSLFKSPEIAKSVQSRNQIQSNSLGSNNILLARIFHNKYVGYTREFLNQYLSYFSAKYLFFEGGGQYRYYNVPNQGLLFISLIPFLGVALLAKEKKLNRKLLALSLYILAIAPIPSALTIDFTPHAHRSLFMILPLVMICGMGFAALTSYGKWFKTVCVLLILGLCIEYIYFWHQYAWQSPSFQSTLRNDGDKQMALYVKEHRTKYDHVFVPIYDRLGLYYLFYTNRFDRSIMGQFGAELRFPYADNVTFVEDWCPSKFVPAKDLPANPLFVDNPVCQLIDDRHVIETLSRKDGTEAYRMVVKKSTLNAK